MPGVSVRTTALHWKGAFLKLNRVDRLGSDKRERPER
jgi:hypothetical protein